MLKLYEFDRQADIHLNPTARNIEVNLAPLVISHTVAASLSALVATGKDHCTVCYEWYFLK
jgi:hypothetical protein